MEGGTEIDLMVSPKAGRAGIEGVNPWRHRLVVKVTAPPSKGRANNEICKLMTGIVSAPTEVVRGHTSRQKTVFVPLPPEKVAKMLEVHG